MSSFVGNKRSKELHTAGCHWVGLMAASNRIEFTSVEEAISQGYNGCDYCLKGVDVWTLSDDGLKVMTLKNVGIGITSPRAKLEVAQSSNTDWAAYIYNDGGGGKGLRVRGAAANTTPVLQVDDNYRKARFLVRSDGNVGVGTTDPKANLDVVGSVNIGQSDGGVLRLGGAQVAERFWRFKARLHETSGERQFVLGWKTETASSAENALVIRTNGYVGIGDDNPGQRLTVAGGNIKLMGGGTYYRGRQRQHYTQGRQR